MSAVSIELPVLARGEGPLALIFLHYWAGSGLEWRFVIDQLAGEHQCLAPDLRGFGAASAPAIGYAIADYVADIAALVAKHQLTNYILVGHSMGGKMALALAAQQPAGLRALVLLTPSPPTPEPMTDADRLSSVRAYGNPKAAAATFAHITARPQPPAVRQQVIRDNLRTSRLAWDAWMLHGSREDISARMAHVQVPVMILAGDADAVLSPTLHGLETLPYLAPDTPLEIIAGAGHLLPLDAPQEVAAAIKKFIITV